MKTEAYYFIKACEKYLTNVDDCFKMLLEPWKWGNDIAQKITSKQNNELVSRHKRNVIAHFHDGSKAEWDDIKLKWIEIQ